MTITAQEVFDRTAKHLLTQNKVSAISGQCLYRGPDGTKCAVGYWIPDDKYVPGKQEAGGMEGCSSYKILDRFPDALPDGIGAHSRLLRDLQRVHDELAPLAWRNSLIALAKSWGLSYAALDPDLWAKRAEVFTPLDPAL